MSEIEALIKTDAVNISHSRRNLSELDPELPAALDTAAGMFRTFCHCMDGVIDDSLDSGIFEECAKVLGKNEEQLMALIESAGHDDPTLNRARSAWHRLHAHYARTIIFLLLERQYMWAATDLLRMRLTPVAGYKRLQAESLALLSLMQEDPSIAFRWMRIKSDEEGRSFYRSLQSQILTVINSLGLGKVYEMGSGIALHVRLDSAARGLSINPGRPGKLLLYYQELRGDDPCSYFSEVLHFLRTQERVFRGLGRAFPEVADPIWPQRVRIFGHTVDGLWEKLEQKYPEECARFRRIASRA